MNERLTLSTAETAALLGVGKRTLQRAVAKGAFPRPVKLGSRSLFRRRDVELFIEAGSMSAFRRAKRGD